MPTGENSLLAFLPGDEHDAIRAGTSQFDCGPALVAAMRAGTPFHIPAGRYVVATPVVFEPQVVGRFANGIRLTGDGPGRTILEDRTQGRAFLDFDSGATPATGFRAIRAVHLSGFGIEGSHAAKGTAAIRMRGCYQSSIRDVHIIGRPGNGIEIPCLLGDADGSNMVELDQVRIENCAGWGIEAAAVPGCNEISFLSLHHVFIQNCGARSDDVLPRSGGMRYKGQMLTMDQCGFTINQNVGLFMPGESGLGINALISSTTFENNIGRHFLCTGFAVFRGMNLQFFSNDYNKIHTACEFNGSKYAVRDIVIDGVTVRATAANSPYVAFRFEGANVVADSCAVRNVFWGDFGHPGQTAFVGAPAIHR